MESRTDDSAELVRLVNEQVRVVRDTANEYRKLFMDALNRLEAAREQSVKLKAELAEAHKSRRVVEGCLSKTLSGGVERITELWNELAAERERTARAVELIDDIIRICAYMPQTHLSLQRWRERRAALDEPQGDIDRLIGRSSLGDAEAREIRAQAPPEAVAAVLARADELDKDTK